MHPEREDFVPPPQQTASLRKRVRPLVPLPLQVTDMVAPANIYRTTLARLERRRSWRVCLAAHSRRRRNNFSVPSGVRSPAGSSEARMGSDLV